MQACTHEAIVCMTRTTVLFEHGRTCTASGSISNAEMMGRPSNRSGWLQTCARMHRRACV
eukprot:56835-Chlamydomonas_euryale.AAC.2